MGTDKQPNNLLNDNESKAVRSPSLSPTSEFPSDIPPSVMAISNLRCPSPLQF